MRPGPLWLLGLGLVAAAPALAQGPEAPVPAALSPPSLAALRAERDRVRADLVALAGDVRAEETALTDTERAVLELSRALEARRAALTQDRASLAALMSALARQARAPDDALLLTSETPLAVLRGRRVLAATLPALNARAAALRGDLVALQEDAARLAAGERRAGTLAGRLEATSVRRADLARALAALEARLEEAEQARDGVRQRIEAEARRARTLPQLVGRVTAATAPLAAPLAPPAPEAPAPTAEDGVREAAARAAGGQPAWHPVVGAVTLGFGDTDPETGERSLNMRFAGRPGGIVTAPADAVVSYARPFRGYGPILILTLADDYAAVLIGLGQIDVAEGEAVLAGQPVGALPGPGGADPPTLTLELRRRDQPVAPQMLERFTDPR